MTHLTLRAYQQADVDRTVRDRRILNASSCGTGKTISAIRSVERAMTFPALIACPTYLVDQWHDVLHDEGYTDNGDIIVAATTATRDGKLIQIGPKEKSELLEEAATSSVKWLIVNHEMLRQPPAQKEKSVQRIWDETAAQFGWNNVASDRVQRRVRRTVHRYRMPPNLRSLVIDESHRLRGAGDMGRGSQQFRGAYQIATRHRIQGSLKTRPANEPGLVIELTATPIYRDVGDLYNQLRLIDPPRFTSRQRFLEQHALLDEDEWGTHVIGARPSAADLITRYGIIHRYSDPDVQIDIPPLIPRTLRCTLSPSGQSSYKKVKDLFRNPTTASAQLYTNSTSQLVALRSLTAKDPEKLALLDELLVDCPPAVIFTFYREAARALSARYELPLSMGGQENARERAEAITAAKAGHSVVATVDSLQEGLDLSKLRAVIWYELDYLPGKLTQAKMRVQRFRPDGSPDPVLLYFIVARGSIDERVLKVATDRGATSDQIMGLEMAAA